jgi:hypothetical protein
MVRSAEAAARETKLAELKRLITTCHYESLEKLEDAVDALLWGDSETAPFADGLDGDRLDARRSPPNRPR